MWYSAALGCSCAVRADADTKRRQGPCVVVGLRGTAELDRIGGGEESLTSTPFPPELVRFRQQFAAWLPSLYKTFSLSGIHRPGFYFFDDGAPGEAYCTPNIAKIANTSGTIRVGKNLLISSAFSDAPWSNSLLGFLAHEIGHIVQWQANYFDQLRPDGKDRPLELHADFLAGWALGKEESFGFDFERLDDMAEHIFLRGSYEFGSPTFHGSPAERYAALVRGFLHARTHSSGQVSDALSAGVTAINSLKEITEGTVE